LYETKTGKTVVVDRRAREMVVAIVSDKDQGAWEESEKQSMERKVEHGGVDVRQCALAGS
jgi:hypothetical protein